MTLERTAWAAVSGAAWRALTQLALLACCATGSVAADVRVRLDRSPTLGDRLRWIPTGPLFLAGRSLERLREGQALAFSISLRLERQGATGVLQRLSSRCVVSYDLWEERFSVEVPARPRVPSQVEANLSARAAEEKCLEAVALPRRGLPEDATLLAHLETRVSEQRPSLSEDEQGVSVGALVEILSGPRNQRPFRWQGSTEPFRLRDLSAGDRP